MAVDLRPLLENSHDVFSTQDIDISYSESDCHKYKISYQNSCPIDGIDAAFPMYLEAQFLNLEFEEVKESQRNRDDTTKKLYHRLTPILRMEFMCNDFFFGTLKVVGLHDEIIVSPINPDGGEYEVDPDSWTVERVGEDDEDTYAVRITFKVKDSTFYSKTCCDDQSIVSFEDPCDIEGGGGGGGIPDPCEDYEVSIDFDGTSLSAVVTGGPVAATPTYVWYYDPAGNGVFSQISTAASFNPVNPGIYRVVATKGTCQMSSDYEYMGDCMDFVVTIAEIAGPVLIAEVNRISTFQWYLDDVAIGGATNSYYVPIASGTYKVEATSIGCVAEDTEDVTVTACAHSVTITRDSNVLTAVVTGNTGDPTYQWYADYGDGAGTVLLSGQTGNTLAITEPGCYEVKVTADGCDKYAKYVVLDVCVGFNAYISGVVNNGLGGVDLTAEAVNPPGDVTFIWYQVINGVYQQIGSGQSITTTATGNVKLVAQSEECVSEDMTFFCVDPETVENYQAWIGDNISYEYVVNNFDLPDPGTYTANQINSMLQVFRNGVKLQYSASPTDRTQYTINMALNQIILDDGFPLKTTEKLEAYLVNIP